MRRVRDGGSGALPQPGHGDGEVAAAELGRDGVTRAGGVQREGEWVQEVAGVLRGAVEKQELACGPPRRRAPPLCAGGRGSREGGRWKMKGGPSCKF